MIRVKSDGCGGGAFFSMDLPGIGMVTADDDGEHDDEHDVRCAAQGRDGR